MIKQKKSKTFIYILIAVVLAGVFFVGFTEIPIKQQNVEENIAIQAQ